MMRVTAPGEPHAEVSGWKGFGEQSAELTAMVRGGDEIGSRGNGIKPGIEEGGQAEQR